MRLFFLLICLSLVPITLLGQVAGIGMGTEELSFPFKSYYGYDYAAAVYLASEITELGDISAISFYHSSGTSNKDVPCSIMLKLTEDVTLTSLDWGALTSGATTVYTGSINYTSPTAGWVNFTLSPPFTLTTGKNLIVLTTASAADGGDPEGSGGEEMHYGHFRENMAAFSEMDEDAPTALVRDSYRPNIRFDFRPLPVQLSSFSLDQSGDAAILRWKTVSEVNNYGFFVQSRSTPEAPFADIPGAFVAGHGTTIAPHDYTWNLGAADHSASAYRLKQVDLDGSTNFSDPVSISTTDVPQGDVPVTFSLDQNYPNPFNPSSTIRFGVPASGHVTISVYTPLGQEVIRLVDGEFTPGYHQATLDGSRLSTGMYYYRMTTPAYTQTRSLILMK